MATLILFAPEIAVLTAALLAVFVDTLAVGRRREAGWIGAAGSLAAAGLALASGRGTADLGGAVFAIDGAAQFARVATCLLVAAFCLWVAGAPAETLRPGPVVALSLLACLGSLVTAGARDWVTLLVAIEAATLPLLVLLGAGVREGHDGDEALRCLVMSAAATMVTAYGVSFVIATSGSLSLSAAKVDAPLGWLAAALVVGGLLAKLGAAPLDGPVRRAFAEAPAWAVALCSAVPKVALVVALARVVEVLGPQVPLSSLVLYALGAASMTLGALTMLRDSDVRGMMAPSGALHAGFVMVALAVGGAFGLRTAVFYALAYAIPSMGIMLVAAEEGPGLAGLSGLSRRRRGAAWALVVFAISLIGVAPTVGFLGKLYVLGGVFRAGAVWAAALGVLLSVLSAGPYGRLVRAAFSGEVALTPPRAGRTTTGAAAIAVIATATVVLGVATWPILVALGLPVP